VRARAGTIPIANMSVRFTSNSDWIDVSQWTDAKCHVWTAPAMQEESDVSAKRSGAAMYPAFECSRYGRRP